MLQTYEWCEEVRPIASYIRIGTVLPNCTLLTWRRNVPSFPVASIPALCPLLRAANAADAQAALWCHGFSVLEPFVEFEWDGLVVYHLAVCSGRFAAGFNLVARYKVIDADL